MERTFSKAILGIFMTIFKREEQSRETELQRERQKNIEIEIVISQGFQDSRVLPHLPPHSAVRQLSCHLQPLSLKIPRIYDCCQLLLRGSCSRRVTPERVSGARRMILHVFLFLSVIQILEAGLVCLYHFHELVQRMGQWFTSQHSAPMEVCQSRTRTDGPDRNTEPSLVS